MTDLRQRSDMKAFSNKALADTMSLNYCLFLKRETAQMVLEWPLPGLCPGHLLAL